MNWNPCWCPRQQICTPCWCPWLANWTKLWSTKNHFFSLSIGNGTPLKPLVPKEVIVREHLTAYQKVVKHLKEYCGPLRYFRACLMICWGTYIVPFTAGRQSWLSSVAGDEESCGCWVGRGNGNVLVPQWESKVQSWYGVMLRSWVEFRWLYRHYCYLLLGLLTDLVFFCKK